MVTWILQKVAGKYLLYALFASLLVNIAQYGTGLVSDYFTSNDTEFTELAVKAALLERDLLTAEQLQADLHETISRKAEAEELANRLLEDEKARAERWKSDGLKFKRLYNERCNDDPECNVWSDSYYRGDG